MHTQRIEFEESTRTQVGRFGVVVANVSVILSIKLRVDARSLSGVRQISLHVHWYAFVVHVIGNS